MEEEKKEEPVNVKIPITKTLSIGQGGKLHRIFTQKAVLIEIINFHKMTLQKLMEKEKVMLEAFDLPTDKEISFDDKTFEITYQG